MKYISYQGPQRLKNRKLTGNSPASTRRLYMFEVKGSVDSLFPRIWAVVAVGMGASRRELRSPNAAIRCFSAAQFQRLPAGGDTPHRSNCSLPLLAGEPTKCQN